MKSFLVLYLQAVLVSLVAVHVVGSGQLPFHGSTNSGCDGHSYGGIKVFTGDVKVGALGDTKSCPVKPWSDAQTKARVASFTVDFGFEYCSVPTVSLSLTKLDASKDYNLRYDFYVDEVTTTGAKITFTTWCNTYIYSARIAVTAIG